jgi:polyvinyl alcohol dehydrogenase (cytochrome)
MSARARAGAAVAAVAIIAIVAAIVLTTTGALGAPSGAARVSTITAAATTARTGNVPAPRPSPATGLTIKPATGGLWTMYARDDARSAYDSLETHLRPNWDPWHQMWVAPDWHALTAQVVTANNLAYMGAWDGYERAVGLGGSLNIVWKTYLGITSATCKPYTLQKNPGVASTPEAVVMNGKPTLFVGGGDAQMYALDAMTGAVVWRTRLGSSPDHFIWSSPVVYRGSVYIGLASTADCPIVAGQVFKLNALTGAIQNTFTAVPPGCTGGEVWDAPTVDDAAGVVYVTTGSRGTCSQPEPYADAVVALSATDLSVVGSWQVPASDQVAHGGFRAAPTLFLATLGHSVHQMLAVGNKNGIFYAFDRTLLASGPVWQQRLGLGGGCTNYMCTRGVVGLAAWDGQTLYVGASASTIAGKSCPGSIQALRPASGAIVWQTCLKDGPAAGGVTLANSGDREVAMVNSGPSVVLLTAATGARFWSYTDPEGQSFFAPVAISNGLLWFPNVDGGMHEQQVS